MYVEWRKRFLLSNRSFQRSARFLAKRCFETNLPASTGIVIAGGGSLGSSVAYHLSKHNSTDVLLVEQGSGGCGTTWHAAGLCGSLRPTEQHTKMSLYAQDLYLKLEHESGLSTGFKRCGSLILAQTEDRATLLRRMKNNSQRWGVSVDEISLSEAQTLSPMLQTDGIKLVLHLPNDGVVNPTDLVQAYQRVATRNGVKIVNGVQVQRINTEKGYVRSVTTNLGTVECDTFVNCTGMWAREVGLMSDPKVDIPLHACQHFYVVTKAMGVDSMAPVVRDYDSHTYTREWSGGLLCGGFEPSAKVCFYDGVPEKFEFQLLSEDWQQFEYLMNGLLRRYPKLQHAEIRQFVNGPESFTPDGASLIGPTMEFKNYYVAAGMCSYGIIGGAGGGKIIADLITQGHSDMHSHQFNLSRFPSGSNNKFYLREASPATLSAAYSLVYPTTESASCRNIMCSPLHALLDKQGAEWGTLGSWECAKFFKLDSEESHGGTFDQPSWLRNVQNELRICNDGVGIVDLSAESKFVLTSIDARAFLTSLRETCDLEISNMEVSDCTRAVMRVQDESVKVGLCRVNENQFLLVASPTCKTILLSHLSQIVIKDGQQIALVEDVTTKYALIGLIGPNTFELLNELLAPPYQTGHMSPGSSKTVDIGYSSQTQLVHCFEDDVIDWKLLVPSEYSQGLYQLLLQRGKRIQNIGSYALESLRVNQMARSQVTGDHIMNNSPLLLSAFLPTNKNWPWGGEPVLCRNNIIGHVKAVGYTLDSCAVLLECVVEKGEVLDARHLKVNVAGDIYRCEVFHDVA